MLFFILTIKVKLCEMTKDTFFKGFENYSLRAVLGSQEN